MAFQPQPEVPSQAPEPSRSISLDSDPKSGFSANPRTNLDTWLGTFPGVPQIQVVWTTGVRLEIMLHAYSQPNIEVGGVLLGKIKPIQKAGSNKAGLSQIQILHSIIAQFTVAQVGSLTFTPETWAEINRERDRDYPDLTIVGWYHTHPGHSVFLSDYDLYIQKHFWQQWYQLALVLDTHAHYGAFFVNNPNPEKKPIKGEEFIWDHELFKYLLKVIPQEASAEPAYQPAAAAEPFLPAARPEQPPAPRMEPGPQISVHSLRDVEPQHFTPEQLQRPQRNQNLAGQGLPPDYPDQSRGGWDWESILTWALVVVFILVVILILFLVLNNRLPFFIR